MDDEAFLVSLADYPNICKEFVRTSDKTLFRNKLVGVSLFVHEAVPQGTMLVGPTRQLMRLLAALEGGVTFEALDPSNRKEEP